MDDQVFQLLNEKFDEIRKDLHEIRDSFQEHIHEDQEYWKEIWFVKRVLTAAWVGIVTLAGWIGWKITP